MFECVVVANDDQVELARKAAIAGKLCAPDVVLALIARINCEQVTVERKAKVVKAKHAALELAVRELRAHMAGMGFPVDGGKFWPKLDDALAVE